MHCNAPDGLCQNTDCKAIGCCQTYPTEPRLNKETKPCLPSAITHSPAPRLSAKRSARVNVPGAAAIGSTDKATSQACSRTEPAPTIASAGASTGTKAYSAPSHATTPITTTFKQTTRLLKCQCDICGYTVRVTRKWLDIGAPHCPDHGAMPDTTTDYRPA